LANDGNGKAYSYCVNHFHSVLGFAVLTANDLNSRPRKRSGRKLMKGVTATNYRNQIRRSMSFRIDSLNWSAL
jgi:hypothetical protein